MMVSVYYRHNYNKKQKQLVDGQISLTIKAESNIGKTTKEITQKVTKIRNSEFARDSLI